jgi:hypothetical protein
MVGFAGWHVPAPHYRTHWHRPKHSKDVFVIGLRPAMSTLDAARLACSMAHPCTGRCRECTDHMYSAFLLSRGWWPPRPCKQPARLAEQVMMPYSCCATLEESMLHGMTVPRISPTVAGPYATCCEICVPAPDIVLVRDGIGVLLTELICSGPLGLYVDWRERRLCHGRQCPQPFSLWPIV